LLMGISINSKSSKINLIWILLGIIYKSVASNADNFTVRRKSMRKLGSLLVVTIMLVVSLTPGLAAAAPASQAGFQVIASGLDNPRGLAFAPGGLLLYVAEAGSGGPGPCAPGPEGEQCFGSSGAVSVINVKKAAQMRVATGLPSLAGADGSFATGPHDISFQGRGNAYVVIGQGGNPADRETNFGPGGAGLAQLVRMTPKGNWKNVSDLGAFEVSANPEATDIDSNPYAVLALPGKQIVADAGGNDLLAVRTNGSVSTLAVFPNRMVDAPPFLGLPPGTQIPMDAVPTSVVQGPDGAFYVGQLTGFPFPVGGANVYRVPAGGGDPEIFASGLTAIVDIAFGPDGKLYVLEIAKNGLLAAFGSGDWTGRLVRIEADGSQTEIASEGLVAPGGMTFGPGGAIYVTNYSTSADSGQVIKIMP
jgi:hypothetical protein